MSSGKDFVIDNKCGNGDNNIIAIIEKLFINIKHRLLYKKLIQKVLHEICEFFLYSLKHIIFQNWGTFCNIESRLKLFHALEIFSLLQMKLNTQSKGILTNKMENKKIRYLIFIKCVAEATRQFKI